MKKISLDIKSFQTGDADQRWMRCINEDNLGDYVDVRIHRGSGGERELVLRVADLLGGNYNTNRIFCYPRESRTRYDYYYMHSRNSDGGFVHEKIYGKEREGVARGMYRDETFVDVDITTNEIMWKETKLQKFARIVKYKYFRYFRNKIFFS